VILNYARAFGTVKWTLAASGNYTFHSKYQATATSLDRECVGYYSVNCNYSGSLQPKYTWSVRNTFTKGSVDLSLLWRHISSMKQ
ncbi:hypothetical protein AAEJ42_23000, partial [Shewanella algae]|uniref:hypothetical protein n=1 Tax=Shewanella algae TaxID=38313 RepID=UPI00313A9648